MSKERKIMIVRIVAAVLIAAISFFGLAKIFVSPDSHEGTLQYLDDKKVAVLEMAGVATATSLAASAIPGDTATPIANELADLVSYFLLITSAIVLEKYLVTVTGYAAFYFLIPLACLFYILFAVNSNESRKRSAIKIAAFAVALFVLVPVSVKISQIIDETYDYASVAAIEEVKKNADEIKEKDKANDSVAKVKNEDESWWNRLTSSLKEAGTELKEDISDKTTIGLDTLQARLNNFIDAIAVLIVTSCVIPIAIMLIFLWLIKMAFGVNIEAPSFANRRKEKREASVNTQD